MLHGTWMIGDLPRKKPPNVLLLLFEGVSAARHPGEIDDKYKFHRFASFAKLETLGLRVRNFAGLNRQTNRGEFSLLCGQFPNLSENAAKMNMYDPTQDQPCLPTILKEHGYRTIYLQAALLDFMNKNRFMPDAGFEHVFGAEIFKVDEGFNTGWGPNDRTLLEKAKEKIIELDAVKGSPWFLTALTVGTHHPYGTAADFGSKYRRGSLEHAMAFLDAEILKLLDWLSTSGLLENTLVLVTADESAGVRKESIDRMAQNWLPLYVLGPGISKASVNNSMFTTADLALSVSDYVFGSKAQDTKFEGRSFFRTYDDERNFVFGNCFFRTVGLVEGNKSIVMCDRDYESCERFRWLDKPFWPYVADTNQAIDIPSIKNLIDTVQWLPDAK